MTTDQIKKRAREMVCQALCACCKLPSDTPVDQYHHEPDCDALTTAILTLTREAVEAEREACAVYCETHQMAVPYGRTPPATPLYAGYVEDPCTPEDMGGSRHAGMGYATAIRARDTGVE